MSGEGAPNQAQMQQQVEALQASLNSTETHSVLTVSPDVIQSLADARVAQANDTADRAHTHIQRAILSAANTLLVANPDKATEISQAFRSIAIFNVVEGTPPTFTFNRFVSPSSPETAREPLATRVDRFLQGSPQEMRAELTSFITALGTDRAKESFLAVINPNNPGRPAAAVGLWQTLQRTDPPIPAGITLGTLIVVPAEAAARDAVAQFVNSLPPEQKEVVTALRAGLITSARPQNGILEADRNRMQTDVQASIDAADTRAMSKQERSIFLGQLMMTTGVAIQESANGTMRATAPKTGMEKIINHIMGALVWFTAMKDKLKGVTSPATGTEAASDTTPEGIRTRGITYFEGLTPRPTIEGGNRVTFANQAVNAPPAAPVSVVFEWTAANNWRCINAPGATATDVATPPLPETGITGAPLAVRQAINGHARHLNGLRTVPVSTPGGPEAPATIESRISAFNSSALNPHFTLAVRMTNGRRDIVITPKVGATFSEDATGILGGPPFQITVQEGGGSAIFENATDETIAQFEAIVQNSVISRLNATFTVPHQEAVRQAMRTPNTWVRAAGEQYDYIVDGTTMYAQHRTTGECRLYDLTVSDIVATVQANKFYNRETRTLVDKPAANTLPRYNTETRMWVPRAAAEITAIKEWRRTEGAAALADRYMSSSGTAPNLIYEYDADGNTEYLFKFDSTTARWNWQYEDDPTWHDINLEPVNIEIDRPGIGANQRGYPRNYDSPLTTSGLNQAMGFINRLRPISDNFPPA